VLSADFPVLADSRGIIMHHYLHRDSVLTSVTGENEAELVIGGGGAPDIPEERVVYALKRVVKQQRGNS